MKRSFNNSEKKFNTLGFDALNINEMMKVRGGGNGDTRDRDMWGDDDDDNG